MPSPRQDESRADFLSRCMGSDEMTSEFSNADQRYAVCVAYWDEKDEKAEGYKPTENMASEAKRGLTWRAEYGRGGTEVGVARARDISNRKNLSLSTVKRMVSYFARHEVDKQGKGWSPGEEGYPSAGRIAWALWGGDAGRSWATKIADREKAMGEIEHKAVRFDLKEIDSDGRVSGYGAVYGNVDDGGDIVMPDAFAGCVERMRMGGSRPKMLWQHDPHQPIGVWDTMKSDDRGLMLQGRILADVAKGREAIALLKAGAVDGLSIGYKTVDQDFRQTERGAVREIKKAELWETSIVTFPMNREARVTDVKQLTTPREVEQILRKAGVPGAFAKLVALHGFEEAKNRLNDSRDAGKLAIEQAQFTALMSEIQGIKELFNVHG